MALLAPKKLHLELTIMVAVGLNSHDPKIMSKFENTIKEFPEVIQCHLIAGQAQDYMLKVIIPSLNDYQIFLLNKLTQIDGVRNVDSSFVLRNIVDKSALPLDHLK